MRQSCIFFGSVIVVCGPDQFLLKPREPIRVLGRAELSTESKFKVLKINILVLYLLVSVPDPEQGQDPYVFGSSGSGFVIYLYGSGSFHHQAQLLRETWISTLWWLLYDFLFLKNDVNVPSKSIKQKKLEKQIFFVGVWKVTDKKSWIRIS